MKILLIEDEPKLGNLLCDGLSNAGHTCDHFSDGLIGLDAAYTGSYELIILDLMLPSLDGLEILSRIRNLPLPPPILVLSAMNDSETVIKALDLGAVDYVKKPFDFQEMMARIRNIQRRKLNQTSYLLRIGEIRLNLLTRNVQVGDQELALSSREFTLLEYLIKHSNQIITKSQILRNVWNIEFDPGSNIVEVHMYQLRKKIEFLGAESPIHTIIGKGYMLRGEVIKG